MASIAADGGFYRTGYSKAINSNYRQFYSREKRTLNMGQISPRKSTKQDMPGKEQYRFTESAGKHFSDYLIRLLHLT